MSLNKNQWTNQQSDEVKILDDILNWLKKLNTVVVSGVSTQIGSPVINGTAGAILFIDGSGNLGQDITDNNGLSRNTSTGNVIIGGAPTNATHKLTVLETGTNVLYIQSSPEAGATARIEVGNDLFGQTGDNGIGYAYLAQSGDLLSTVVGEQNGINVIRSGYDSTNGDSQNITIATDYVQVLSLDTALGNIPIGVAVTDKTSDGGVVVQGKGTGNEVAFRVKQGSYPNLFNGNDVFTVTCDGKVTVSSLAGSGDGVVGVDNSGVLNFTSYQSIGANLIIDDNDANIYTRNANPLKWFICYYRDWARRIWGYSFHCYWAFFSRRTKFCRYRIICRSSTKCCCNFRTCSAEKSIAIIGDNYCS
ncbi:MAG: hypothetical protein KatS3mg002_1378 [Candidatus Woesearchaeota archaeon]|nr:MAG: hypothetical protein KatS3mg002_1378 [Candidatus Woesearchaeota archaeon]